MESTYSGFRNLTYPIIILNTSILLFNACKLRFLFGIYQYWMSPPTFFIKNHCPEIPNHNYHQTLVTPYFGRKNLPKFSLELSTLLFAVTMNWIHHHWLLGCMLLVTLIKNQDIRWDDIQNKQPTITKIHISPEISIENQEELLVRT